MKIFDYKFLLTLGLCLIVYFLYREVDILTKRVSVLEKGTKEKKQIDLPLPPVEETKNIQMMETKMVEEYNNDNIYSHDNLHTHTNDNDTLMVESILNMVKDDLNNNNIAEVSIHVEQIQESNDLAEPIDENKEESKLSEHLEESNVSDDSNIVLIKDNTENKISLETLNKKKLDELQELASKYNIDINYENGKRKKKSDLAQEIFTKQ